MIFADVSTEGALGGSALVLVVLNMVRDAWKDFWDRKTKANQALLDSQERKAKIDADCALALRNADIAAATIKLTGQVETLNNKIKISEQDRADLRQKIDDCGVAHEETKKCQEETQKKLDECEEKHQQAAEVQSAQRVDIEAIKKIVGLTK